MFDSFADGLSYLGNSTYWIAFFGAVAITVPIALIPGISATLVMALSIPFIITNVNDPVIGLAMLATLTGIDNTLDSIPAILLGMPGGATQVTFLEGNQLAQQGKASHTLGAVYVVSAIGGLVGAGMLAILIPVIKPFVLKFGFAEIAAMAMFGVAMVAALSGGAMLKGMASALIGIWLAGFGQDPIFGLDRYTFDVSFFAWNGIPLIATTIGLFALPEMIDLTMTRKPVAPVGSKVSYSDLFAGGRYGLTKWPMAVRQSLFGVFLGAVPGIGSGVVDWLSYAFGIFWTKDKSQFGKGSLDGVLFAESAQNAKEGGQAVPTLAFGVPGGRAWAFVIVAMLAYGIAPGPQMLEQHADVTIMMVISLGLGNLAVTMLGFGFTGFMARLTLIPYPVLGFLVIPVAFLSAYQETIDIMSMYIVLGFAGLGLIMKQYKWPRPPLMIGFILGVVIEENLQSAISIYGWGGFLVRPLFIGLFILSIVTAVVFTKFMGSSASQPPAVVGASGVPPIAGASGTGSAMRTMTWRWTQGQIFTFFVVLVSGVAFIGTFSAFEGLIDGLIHESWTPSSRAALFPRLATGGLFGLSLAQFIREGLGTKTGDVMDIGMRSTGMEGSRNTALIFAAVLLMLWFLSGTIGLKYAAVIMALVGPGAIMRNRTGYAGGVVVAFAVLLINLVFFDRVMAVLWPKAFILDFLGWDLFGRNFAGF